MRRRRITVSVVLEGDSRADTAHRRGRTVEDAVVVAVGDDLAPYRVERIETKIEVLRPTAEGWEPA